MIELKEILAVLDTPSFGGDTTVPILGVTHDSRQIEPGWLFAAMPGEKSDGHDFVRDALRRGAVAALAEKPRPADVNEAIGWICIPNTRRALGKVAAAVYGRPTSKMALVGITGTNGKTSLTYLLEAIVTAAGGNPGVIGTITYRWGGKTKPAARTTPEASDLQWMFKEMVESGVTHTLMEVSSHGLHLGRLDGCDFDVGVFTNLTQDHLDYHGNFEDYYLAKRMLFDELLPVSAKGNPVAAINLDDPYGERLARETAKVPVLRYGTRAECEVHPLKVSLGISGISGTLQTPSGPLSLESRLTGSFNLENIMAAVAVAQVLGFPAQAIRDGIRSVEVVPGRLERVPSERGFVFVDYAHTPDALKNVLAALRIIRAGRIITVMGCGGDRDRTKRPVMGKEAAAGSDFVVVTSDNPRSEDPGTIVRQVEQGVKEYGFAPHSEQTNGLQLRPGHYQVIADRREAIAWAVKHLRKEDILLVAGKGHETYQEIEGVRYPFDDRDVLREELTKNLNLESVSGHKTPGNAISGGEKPTSGRIGE
ncbi:MAG: UDP-N-acetylmuramoyl-L-alanyl-D-glutamate--2,6-diaminopimelate ligase [Desulfomonile tiedjei]|nr:UDP-N-acetylmuramoyl-L-alanyl-D-glutamate--2,6-diaminopimelate ligase [Desulfomonile tiedjei]